MHCTPFFASVAAFQCVVANLIKLGVLGREQKNMLKQFIDFQKCFIPFSIFTLCLSVSFPNLWPQETLEPCQLWTAMCLRHSGFCRFYSWPLGFERHRKDVEIEVDLKTFPGSCMVM